jgi:threonine/homoserine/homoserine lactone efflux protein
MDHLPTFLLAVLLLELTPGPNMAYLATLALSRGRAAGLIATIGVTFGLAVHAAVAGLGAGALIQQYPLLYEVLRWIGVGYLLYLAWEGWQTEKEVSPERANLAVTAGPLFLRGFLSNVFNPKSILFFVSVLPTFVAASPAAPSLPIQMAVFGTLYVGIATAVHTTIVVLAAQLRPWLVEGPRQQMVRRILSVMLALVAIWLAWTTQR